MRKLKFTDPVTGRPSLLLWILLSALAVALCAISVPVHTVLYGIPLALAFGVGIVQMGAIPLTIIRPRVAIVLTLLCTLALPELSRSSVDAPWPWSVTSMLSTIAVITVLAFSARWTYPVITWILSAAVSIVAIATSPTRYDSLDPSATNSIVYIAISGGALAVALLLAQRRGIRAQLVQERQITAAEQAKRELVEERSRIARELHDVVAHGMSVIQVQATSAKYRLPEMSDEVAAEFDDIGATARGALTEMRQLLGVLRGAANPDSTQAAELGPQPTLFEIPALVETSRRAGVPVSLVWQVSGDAAPPASVALTAYRIVQESLSNVVRHAPGAATTVTVEQGNATIMVTVKNEASKAGSVTDDRGGQGLIGMRERVQLVGGRLEHGATSEGGYRVAASLPTTP